MECKVTGRSLITCDTVYDGTAELPVDVDFTLPEYCRDIGKILRCRAVPIVQTNQLQRDTLAVEGVLRITVLYADDRDKDLRCCEHEMPFAAKFSVGDCPDTAKAEITAKVDYMNCRAMSQRRVDIHGALSLRARLSAPKRCEMIEQVQGEGIYTRRRDCVCSEYVGRTQTPFTISESLELAQTSAPMSAVVRSSACIRSCDCKSIANKLILKGEAVLTVVYSTEQGDKVDRMEYLLPFNQFLDLAGADDDCTCDAHISVQTCDIAMRTNQDGEYRRISADIRCLADIKAFRPTTLEMVTDAYSTCCELDIERRTFEFERCAADISGKGAASCTVESMRDIERVLDAWCEVTSVGAETDEEKAHISGNAMMCAVVGCEDGEREYLEQTCRFECDIPLPQSLNNARIEPRAAVSGCTYTLVGSGKLDMRADIEIASCVYDQTRMQTVTAISPDESRPKNAEKRPSVVMYFASDGEDLWDIAREHSACVDDIISENALDGGDTVDARLLLIAVK